MACEKCWQDASARERADPNKTHYEHYRDLLEERKDNPCGPEWESENYFKMQREKDTEA
jgi:hypothetical protein